MRRQFLDSPNFAFLAALDANLVRLGSEAELLLGGHPDLSLVRLRQLGERLARLTAVRGGVAVGIDDSQANLVRRLADRRLISGRLPGLFDALRRAGNQAAHEAVGSERNARLGIRAAHELAVWFYRTFAPAPGFAAEFVPPVAAPWPTPAERAEVERLRAELAELGADREALAAELAALQAAVAPRNPAEEAALVDTAQAAAQRVDLPEAETRELIDLALRAAGWEADSVTLRWGAGTRPQKGRNLAIAEVPIAGDRADYVLFAGTTPLAAVEAKRRSTHVPGSLEQAARYARGFRLPGDGSLTPPAGGPWGDFTLPFLFATNGRPYLRQVAEASGVWFRDARRPANLPRALESWYTPDGLTALLKQDVDRAEADLAARPIEALAFLRPYQREVIAKTEAALAAGQRQMLIAMATGTGKTKTAIALVYRLLAAGRFRRILFLVDRKALGEQAGGAFISTRMESLLTFAETYELQEVDTPGFDPGAQVRLATVQGFARRLLADDPAGLEPVDAYDLLVVDECHRGYLLDRELGEDDFAFRDEADYISAYRRVLDHFDAVKIGLTATPALHTVEIFGRPIAQYTYRQAVCEGFLVDCEPPLCIVTERGQDGIVWQAGEEMLRLEPATGELDTVTLPDEVKAELPEFNRTVVTEPWNRTVCEVLARHLDPSLGLKTIVFCLNDRHADLVVRLLREAFAARYGNLPHDTVMKITGRSDRPRALIRRFRNERQPNVAVTVDLLTTGIDVPEVGNLVFLRPVKSRILYEQMLGRATRPCPELFKESFQVFDAVRVSAAMAELSAMQPVVARPTLSFAELLAELPARRAKGDAALATGLAEFVAKLRRKRFRLGEEGEAAVRAASGGLDATGVADHLVALPPAEAATWLEAHAALAAVLDRATRPGPWLRISEHPDALVAELREYSPGVAAPGDYLESFAAFLRGHPNEIPALLAVTQRPRELTRRDLAKLQLALDAHGFSEVALRTAWRERTNQDIAASILGHVRQAALGDPLLPYSERVDRAVRTLTERHSLTGPQKGWLRRIAEQIKQEGVVDREALDTGAFQSEGGGFRRLDRVFGGHLTEILGDLAEEIWRRAG